jgi:hypothetical protein
MGYVYVSFGSALMIAIYIGIEYLLEDKDDEYTNK